MLDSWLLFGHLIGVAALITAFALEGFMLAAGGRASLVAELRLLARIARILLVLMPVSAATLTAFGIALVAHRSPSPSFGDAWIVASIGIVVVMSVLSITISEPRVRAFAAAAEAAPDGPVPAELAAPATDAGLTIVDRANGVALIEVLWLMAVKPSASGTLVSLALALVLAAGAAMSVRAKVAVRTPVAAGEPAAESAS